MHRYRFGRRRRRGVGVLVLLLLFTTLLLVSCMAGSDILWVRGFFGADIEEMIAEPVLQTHEVNGALAETLSQTVDIVLDDRIHLRPFRGTDEAVELYRDEILGYMLRANYQAYTGNRDAIERAEAAYPHTVFMTLIPKRDFENTVFRHFGGTSVLHEDGTSFAYLKNASYYTTPISPRERQVTLTVQSLEETANTYRLVFILSDGEETSTPYTAVFVKRDDGTAYWNALEN